MQLGCQGGVAGGGAGPHLGALRGSQVAQEDLTKGPKLALQFGVGEERSYPPAFHLCPHLLLSLYVLDWATTSPPPTHRATTFPGAKLLSWGAGVGAGADRSDKHQVEWAS